VEEYPRLYASLGDTIENKEFNHNSGSNDQLQFRKVASCKYNLEQLLSAGLDGPVFGNSKNQMTESDKMLLDDLAEADTRPISILNIIRSLCLIWRSDAVVVLGIRMLVPGR